MLTRARHALTASALPLYFFILFVVSPFLIKSHEKQKGEKGQQATEW